MQLAPVDTCRKCVRRSVAQEPSYREPVAFSMKKRLAFAVALTCLMFWTGTSEAADEATLLRVFLLDGTSLVSYGEFARVGDRVVFSMPTASAPNPPLQLVNIPANRVDWSRTTRYADSARASRYASTRAEDDYVLLNNVVARALNDAAFASEPARRLEIVENARKAVAEWPSQHYHYRHADVRQMLSMLDEAIADLRASAGGQRFDLSLVALAEPLPEAEPLLPLPTPMEAIEQLLTASRVADSPAERQSILSAVLLSLDREASNVPREWAEAARARTQAALDQEAAIDRSYQAMIRGLLTQATVRARQADIRGIRRALEVLRQRDVALGEKRPDVIASARAAIDAQLEAARRLRLARDRWALRIAVLREYNDLMGPSLVIFGSLQEPLADIKELAGSTQASLTFVQRQVERILQLIENIMPPDECRTAHALLVSAAHLAGNAAKIRREATLSGELARAWDASSAAAGAMMLTARAITDIKSSLRPPQLQ